MAFNELGRSTKWGGLVLFLILPAVLTIFVWPTIPSFADRVAPVPTTHNPKAFFVMSLLALLANASLAVYQFSKVRKNRLNILKDEIFTDTKAYKKVAEDNK